jgi:hypothetical protein
MAIAPNQDFAMAYVPLQEADTASGILGTAQLIGIIVIGTVPFGTISIRRGADAQAYVYSISA